jgi:cytochrome c553
MRKSICVGVLALGSVLAFAEDRPPIQPQPWAFQVPDKIHPADEVRSGPLQVPGSSKTFTAEEIDDLFNPPDWFPEEHSAAPGIVQHGPEGVQACGSCHLMSGHGHPESADLAGLPVEYLVRQMADFKSGARKDPIEMSAIGKAMSSDDARQAAEWFASLKPSAWVKVVEADTVPRSYVTLNGRMRLPWPGTLKERIGKRIIELPEDPARTKNRDPHSGFIAYVPKGSIAKGAELVKTGGSGKTIACGICHGDSLEGIGDVPRLAGLHPTYVFRQLLYFYEGEAHTGTSAALMKKVVPKLTEDDMLAIAAYVASLDPSQPAGPAHQ